MTTISVHCLKLDKLELAGNNKMQMKNLGNLLKLKYLTKLNIKYSKIIGDHLIQLCKYANLNHLNLEGNFNK